MKNESRNETIAVLGAGSWGTALALLLAETVGTVHLWDRTPAHAEALQTDRENKRYLPGVFLPPAIVPTADMGEAVRGASGVVIATPSPAVGETVARAAPFLQSNCVLVLAAKGMESETARLPCDVVRAALQSAHTTSAMFPIVALSGPNLAGEIVKGVPAACVAASTDEAAAQQTALWFNRPTFRVYTSPDIVGVEMGGAMKNVLAIAGGVSDGLGFGDNTKAALLTRGLGEMTRLGAACGARLETFYGLSGMGDLMATAASRLSRNYRVGLGLARNEPLDAILQNLGQVAEGVQTAQAVRVLARQKNVDLPVCEAVAALLFDHASPTETVRALMARAQKNE